MEAIVEKIQEIAPVEEIKKTFKLFDDETGNI